MVTINIIACIDGHNAIGYKNKLLYHIPEDLTRFRQLTTGHTILMGRKTYESLPNGALPNRRNIVISRQDICPKNCEVFSSIEQALNACQNEIIFVIGGASIYEQTLPLAERLYLTKVESSSAYVDTYFPTIDEKDWEIALDGEGNILASDRNQTLHYHFYIYKRRGRKV